jgi:hypothetical protein
VRARRFRWALVVALAAHAGGSCWVWYAAKERAVDGAPADALGVTEAYIEIEAPPVSSSMADSLAPSSEPSAPAGLNAPRSAPGARGGAVAIEGGQAPAPSAETAADGTWTFSPTTAGSSPEAGTLSGDALASAVRAGVAATVAEDTKKREAYARTHVLPVFTPHDVALGLAPGGELVTLTRDLVRRSRAPTNGRALLQFDTDGAGIVASVRVLDVSSERAEWDQVAAEIAASARTRPMRVPTGARGLAITLEVTSALKTVNGGTPTDNPLAKVAGAVMDPLGTVMDAKTPAQRVVAARLVDVQAF